MGATIIGIRHARDQAGRLQPVEQTNECNRPDVENLSECGLIDTFVLREANEDGTPRTSQSWNLGAQLPIVATAPQPSRLVQQPYNRVWIIRVGIILGT